MANLFLNPNQGHFKATSFDDYVKPLNIYKEAFDKRAEEYNTIHNATTALYDQIQGEGNEEARKLYDDYYNKLSSATDDLMKYGLNLNTQARALGVKNDYNTMIKPITSAVELKKKAIEKYEDELSKDSSKLHRYNPHEITGLDKFLYKTDFENKSLSGNELKNDVKMMAANLSKGAINDPAVWKKILGGQYFEQMKQHGFTIDQLSEYLRDPNNADKKYDILNNILDYVAEARGLNSDEWSDDIREQAYKYMNQGLFDSIGQVEYKQLENWRAKLNAQEAAKAKARAAALEQDRVQNMRIDDRSMYAMIKNKRSKKMNAIEDVMKAEGTKDFFTRDENGYVKLTEKGKKAWNDYVNKSDKISGYHIGKNTVNNYVDNHPEIKPFIDAMEDILPWWEYSKLLDDTKLQKYLDEVHAELPEEDALKQTYFVYTPTYSDREDIQNRLLSMTGANFYNAVWDAEQNGYVKGDEKINATDIFDKDNRLGDLMFGYNGKVAFNYLGDDGEYYPIFLETDESNIQAIQSAAQKAQAKQAHMLELNAQLENPSITEEEKKQIMEQIQKDNYDYGVLMQYAYRSLANSIGTNKIKTQDFTPLGTDGF